MIERFQFLYVRFESITREYIVIREWVEKCSNEEELRELKERMQQLQHQ